MADFTAADVKRLRELTAAGMMDCKNALVEADGDFDKAVDILRTKGAKDVGKRAARVAANGLVAVSGPAIIELNCETDFVAKNAQFQELAASIAGLVEATRPADVEATLESILPEGQTVRAAIEAVSAIIGEKLELRRVAVLEGTIATYVHRKDPALPPQIGVLVSYEGADTASDKVAAKVVAQQVERVYPQAVSRSTDVVPDIYQRAKVKDGWVKLATSLIKGERVRLIGKKTERYGLRQLAKISDRIESQSGGVGGGGGVDHSLLLELADERTAVQPLGLGVREPLEQVARLQVPNRIGHQVPLAIRELGR